jgi:succinoglycan biosynthesis transport protein ExoP
MDHNSSDTPLFNQESRCDTSPSALGSCTSAKPSDYSSVVLQETEAHILDHARVVYKRRRTAITAFVLIVGGVAVYTFTATPIYEAKTRLLIEPDNPNVVSFAEVINDKQENADYYQTQYSILQSRTLARKTLDSLQLWSTPPFGGTGSSAVAVGETAIVDETSAQSRAIDVFLANLSVSPIRLSRLVDLKYRLPDARLATRIINSLGQNYIEQNLEYKFFASKEASDWLGERLAEQRQLVERAELKLQQYREQNGSISLPDRENIVVRKLADLNAAVTLARTERFQKEAVYTQVQALRRNNVALDSFPAILGNTFIQQQKSELALLQREYAQASEKLGDRHPDMIKIRSAVEMTQARLDAEIGKTVEAVRNEYQAALAKEQSLTEALNAQKGDALSMNRQAIDYNALERDVQSSKQMYESLMQRAKETGISAALKTTNIRVVDAAGLPRSPVSPRKQLSMILGVLGGGMVALVLVFFFEFIDNRIKTPDEITKHLGLPFLGLIPALNPKTCAYPLLDNGVPPNFGEAFRSIRTNVRFSSAEEGSRSLLVASAAPGEGKTLVATNLAIAFAQTGLRVLLIDADMRRGCIHERLSVAQEPGLSNLLAGNAKASEVVRKSSTPGLWVLACGRLPPNPAELVGSQRFRDFVTSLTPHFDWVIIDSPPVMAVTDAAIAGSFASGVLFVVGSQMTSRQAARTAVEQLANGRAHFIGAVLNRVELERDAYFYSKYYRREYGAYHLAPPAGAFENPYYVPERSTLVTGPGRAS